ncbi:MAG: DUF2024 family protein [Planctomycetales bacterium]|nr:DUF2024 family protein [Planctomycetales bacterium]
MRVDCYDTYATGQDGSILHFDLIVAAGTPKAVVEEVAARFAGSPLPEVDAELRRKSNSRQSEFPLDSLQAVMETGFAILPPVNRKRLAA